MLQRLHHDQNADRSGLACAIWANQAHDGSAMQAPCDVLQREKAI
jgi:hypothetical protein